MSTNELKLVEVETAIHSQPAELRAVYGVKLGLAEMLAAVEKPALEHLLCQGRNNLFSARAVADALEGLWARGGGAEVAAISKVHAGISAIENHPLHDEAVRVFQPLFAERVRLQDAIAAEVKRLDDATAAAENALFEAKERALLAAESDPAVTAATAALTRLQNPPEPAPPVRPFRGKVALLPD